MKKILLMFSLLLLVSFSSACSKSASFDLKDPNAVIAPNSDFMVGEVVDKSGYVPKEDDPQVDLVNSLKNALEKTVESQGIEGDDYRIETEILVYEPGNAFKRWLMPGWGSTKFVTKSLIYDKNNTLIATVPVERSIGFGGAFTIGAWKDVIDEVAKEIIFAIKKAMYQ